jgi:Cohesin domain/PEP-CTERM motif
VVSSLLTGGFMGCRRLIFPALLIAGLLVATPARAASISIDSLVVNQGDVLTLGIRVTDITDLFTFGFDLAFDPTVLQATSIVEGDFLSSAINTQDGGTFFGPGAISEGLVSFTLGSLFGPTQLGASGSGALAFITFQALTGGSTSLSLLNVFLLDSTGTGVEIPADILSGLVTVAPTSVPEPSTLGLLGIGLAVLARKRLRRHPQRRP